MLSYRHAFHAGNHADVLKHLCLLLALDRLLLKPKPLVYIDTHAGAGCYDLHAAAVRGRQEAASGLARLRAQAPAMPVIRRYLALQQGGRYLGSPALASALLRPDDRMILMELHNSEIELLRKNCRGRGFGSGMRAMNGADTPPTSRPDAGPTVAIHHRDGFEGLPALLPPSPARGLVLIDPAYEDKGDYQRVIDAVAEGLRRWAHGCYLVWYPVLATGRDRSEWLLRNLKRLAGESLLLAELRVQAQADDFGMCGSGLAVVNPPWQLDEQLTNLLPSLHEVLADPGAGGWRLAGKG